MPAECENVIVLSEEFYREVIAHPIPTDLDAVKVLAGAPAVLDLFMWLSYRCFTTQGEERIPIFGSGGLTAQLGSMEYSRPRRFRAKLEQWLDVIRAPWPDCPAALRADGLMLRVRHASSVIQDKERLHAAEHLCEHRFGREATRLFYTLSWFMWEFIQKNTFLVAAATGSLATFLITLFVSHLRREKRWIGYSVSSQNVVRRQSGKLRIQFEVRDIQRLDLHAVVVRNTGNRALSKVPIRLIPPSGGVILEASTTPLRAWMSSSPWQRVPPFSHATCLIPGRRLKNINHC